MPPTTFGVLRVCQIGIARVHPLGAEGEEEILADLEPGALERRQQDLARRAGIGRALEDDRLAAPERALHRLGGGHDVADVGILELRERRRHADGDRVRLAQPRRVGGRLEASRVHDGLASWASVTSFTCEWPAVQAVHDPLADVEAEHAVARLGQLHRERQADVAEPDDPEEHLAALGLADQLLCHAHHTSPSAETAPLMRRTREPRR